jgi:hypothetical protein
MSLYYENLLRRPWRSGPWGLRRAPLGESGDEAARMIGEVSPAEATTVP